MREAALVTDPASGAQMVRATWADDERSPQVEVVSRMRTRNRFNDWPHAPRPQPPADLASHLKSTELIGTDGIVAAAAATITADKLTDVDKVRAIYDWVVAHDVGLPGSRGAKLPFLMYPPAETRVDSLDPDPFKYTITAREVAA